MNPHFAIRALCALVLSASSVAAQTGVFATKVVAFDTKNNAGGGVFQPANALGAPSSATAHVHSLGVDGHLTLGFDVTITDGPGDDLIVFENPFYVVSQVYAEVMFVEVSSNGSDFARFPSRYQGPATSGGSFAINWAGYYAGLAGVKPHNGGVTGVDMLDVVQVGGDSFDLADLKGHPLVIGGKVDLGKIAQVRLVDVVAGTSKDTAGKVIEDPTAGSADVDAVAVIHHTGNVTGKGPVVAVDLPPSGDVTLTLGDPDGLTDLDPASLRMALDGMPFPPLALISVMTVQQATSTSVTLRLGGSLPQGVLFHLAVSLKDKAGQRSGQTRVR